MNENDCGPLVGPSDQLLVCLPIFNDIGKRYLFAIRDWSAPFEVAATVGVNIRDAEALLPWLANLGVAKHHKGNNTYRLTDVGRTALGDGVKP